MNRKNETIKNSVRNNKEIMKIEEITFFIMDSEVMEYVNDKIDAKILPIYMNKKGIVP